MAKGTRQELDKLLESAWEAQRKHREWIEKHPVENTMSQNIPADNMAKVSRVVGGGLIALFCALCIAALTFFGIIGSTAAHLCMFLAWIVGSLLICTEIIPGKAARHKYISVLSLAVIMLAADLAMAHLNKGEPQQKLRSYIDIGVLEIRPTNVTPSIHITYRNSGPIATRREMVFGTPFYRPLPPTQPTMDELFTEFEKKFNAQPLTSVNWRPPMDPGNSRPDDYYSNELNQIKLDDTFSPKEWVYFIGGILHSDETGHYRKAFCYVWFNSIDLTDLNIMANWKECHLSQATTWEQQASSDTY